MVTLPVLTRSKDNATIILRTPFAPGFAERAKALGGRWAAASEAWLFDARDTDRVRALCADVWGIDPLAPAPEVVTLRLTDLPNQREVWLGGRFIAGRRFRDRQPELGPGVSVVAGGFARSGGSAAHPVLQPEPSTVLEVRDVPRPLAERFAGTTARPRVEIVADAPPPAVPPVVTQIKQLARLLSREQRAQLVEYLQQLD